MKRIKISKDGMTILKLMMNRSKTKLSDKILCYILIKTQEHYNFVNSPRNICGEKMEDLDIVKGEIRCVFGDYSRKTIFNALKELEDENIIIIKEGYHRGIHKPYIDRIEINWDQFA